MATKKTEKRIRRHNRIRAKIIGDAERPRLSVYRSNKNLIAQIINDDKGETLVYVWSRKIEGSALKEKAQNMGTKLAELAKKAKISKVVFDRGGYVYKGNIKVLADSARQAGLEF
jgi:large subunit ribosomal protein L18